MELVPVVLAMKESMGEENFRKWVESMQVRIPTKFKTKTDLVKCIKKAGYDAQNWGSSVKTHIKGEKNFFFWEFADGRWNAIFSKSDPNNMIMNFIKDLETKNGTKIFSIGSNDVEIPKIQVHKSSTNFKDENLLIKTLSEYGTNPVKNPNGDIIVNIDGGNFKFFKIGKEPYTVEIEIKGEANGILNHLSLLDGDYKNNVQAYTYENLKQNLEDKNWDIESEEVLEDNSILITVNINK